VAAVVLPSYHDRWQRVIPTQPTQPVLRLVPPCRPTPAVYRRRRTLAGLVAAVVTLVMLPVGVPLLRAGVGVLGGSPLASSGAPAVAHLQPALAEVYVVRRGDTLWSIARAVHPSGDVRPLVDRLASGRHGLPLHPGDRITIP
jgi:hypothetical protein